MGRTLRLPAVITNLILVIGLVVIWFVFAPTKIGGQTSYVIIHGKSMEPRFHAGDLALIRKSSSYKVGDIVTYWDDSMAAYTIHRIINIAQDRFILQGDNNSWIDPIQPGQEEILGELWVHIPGLGKTMEWLRAPLNFALIIGLAGGILMAGKVITPNRNRKKELVNLNPIGLLGAGLYMFGFLFFVFLAFSFYAFSRPVSIPSNDILYQQEGLFSYSATATPGIYDSATVQSGEPIFTKLTCLLNVGFSYNLFGNQVQGISGNNQLYARVINEQSGWHRTIPMSQIMPFNGTPFFNKGTIDLCQIEALVTTLEQETGMRSSTYTMEIVSAVTLMGNVNGETITDSFVPILTFKFDEAQFYLDSQGEDENVFLTSEPSMSSSTNLHANILSLLGLETTVQAARIIAVSGLLFSLCGLLAIGLYLYYTVQQNQEALIRLKHGSLLVEVYEGTYEPAPPVIDVASIDNLAKLAERHNTMILHIIHDFLHDYLVQGNQATYRYSISSGTTNRNARTPVQQEPIGYVFPTGPSQLAETRNAYQDLANWNESRPYYEIEDTQPGKPVQRRYVTSTYGDAPVYNEPDGTVIIGKIKF